MTQPINDGNVNLPDFSRGTDGLLPAIAQEAENGCVLMLAWMNADAYAETLSTGYAVYYSRSRQALWRKGETSGHRQKVVEIRIDCDADAILLKIHQRGAACHEGYKSCFFRVANVSGEFEIADHRIVDPAAVYGKQT